MIYSGFAEARAAQAAGDIPSNTSAGEIKQSAHRGQAGQEAALNIPSAFPGAAVITEALPNPSPGLLARHRWFLVQRGSCVGFPRLDVHQGCGTLRAGSGAGS